MKHWEEHCELPAENKLVAADIDCILSLNQKRVLEGETPETLLADKEDIDFLCNALKQLSPKEQAIIQHVLYDDLTLKDVGAAFNIGRERARTIQEDALSKLRHIYQNRDVVGLFEIMTLAAKAKERADIAWKAEKAAKQQLAEKHKAAKRRWLRECKTAYEVHKQKQREWQQRWQEYLVLCDPMLLQ